MYDYDHLLAQNRLLSDEVKRRVDHLTAINNVAASVSQSLDLSETLQTALDSVLSITEAEAGGISLIEEIIGRRGAARAAGLDSRLREPEPDAHP